MLAKVVHLLLLGVTYAGLLGAGEGEGSCAAAPFRAHHVQWEYGCPSFASCCSEFGFCRPLEEWLHGVFRDCNGVSNGSPLPQETILAEAAAGPYHGQPAGKIGPPPPQHGAKPYADVPPVYHPPQPLVHHPPPPPVHRPTPTSYLPPPPPPPTPVYHPPPPPPPTPVYHLPPPPSPTPVYRPVPPTPVYHPLPPPLVHHSVLPPFPHPSPTIKPQIHHSASTKPFIHHSPSPQPFIQPTPGPKPFHHPPTPQPFHYTSPNPTTFIHLNPTVLHHVPKHVHAPPIPHQQTAPYHIPPPHHLPAPAPPPYSPQSVHLHHAAPFHFPPPQPPQYPPPPHHYPPPPAPHYAPHPPPFYPPTIHHPHQPAHLPPLPPAPIALHHSSLAPLTPPHHPPANQRQCQHPEGGGSYTCISFGAPHTPLFAYHTLQDVSHGFQIGAGSGFTGESHPTTLFSGLPSYRRVRRRLDLLPSYYTQPVATYPAPHSSYPPPHSSYPMSARLSLPSLLPALYQTNFLTGQKLNNTEFIQKDDNIRKKRKTSKAETQETGESQTNITMTNPPLSVYQTNFSTVQIASLLGNSQNISESLEVNITANVLPSPNSKPSSQFP